MSTVLNQDAMAYHVVASHLLPTAAINAVRVDY